MTTHKNTMSLISVLWLLVGSLSPALSAQDAPTVLITGSNRGLGLEFARQYALRGWTVIATARQPEAADALKLLATEHANVRIEALDVTNSSMIETLRSKLAGEPIDVLLNNAGILGDVSGQFFGKLESDEFTEVMITNALSPLIMAEAFIENVMMSEQKKIVAISSRGGSFSEQRRGMPGLYFYKSSKTALNMLLFTLAKDLRDNGVTVLLLSPGTVDTRQLGIKSPRLVAIDVSIAGMIGVIDQATPEMSGDFIRYTGEVQPW
jgi:NAD(P)-dependent dehydrogenase (short-subunit alcohol dehydrogenase family)